MLRKINNGFAGWQLVAAMVILCFHMAAHAQPIPNPTEVPDEWDYYPCKVDDGPASIILNFWYQNRAPIAHAPVLYWCAIRMKEPGEHGMGVGEDADHLRDLEDTLNIIASQAGMYPVGRLRNHGVWQLIYYGPDGLDIESLFSDKLREEKRKYTVGSSDDPQWKYYKEFLLPDDERRRWMYDGRVVRSLQEHGDTLTQPRRVDHWLYCQTPESRQKLQNILVNDGFKVESAWEDSENSSERPYALQVYRVDSVEHEAIHAVIMKLINQTKSVGADYDGWETFVIKPDSEPSDKPIHNQQE